MKTQREVFNKLFKRGNELERRLSWLLNLKICKKHNLFIQMQEICSKRFNEFKDKIEDGERKLIKLSGVKDEISRVGNKLNLLV